MADGDPADVFAFPDFEKPSKWLAPSSNQDSPFFSLDSLRGSLHGGTEQNSKPFDGHVNTEPSTVDQDGFFKLPPLFEPLAADTEQEPDQGYSSTILTPLHDTTLPDIDVFDDAWLEESQQTLPKSSKFKTWEGFLLSEIPEHTPWFITEAGPVVYDTVLIAEDDPLNLGNTDCEIIQTNPFVAALWGLALGRGSVFFVWDEKTSSFTPALDRMRISGYSSEVLQGVVDACLQCGTITRFLSNHVRTTYKTHPSPIKVALAKAIDMILLAVQTRLGEKTKQIRSVLQLQSIIQPVCAVLAYLKPLVAKVSRLKIDEHVLSVIFDEARTLENVDRLLASIMREVLVRISEPWADFVEKWLGVKDEDGVPLTKEGIGKSFVKIEPVSYMDDFGVEVEELDYVMDDNRIPNFIPTEVASTTFEAGKTLRLLRTYHPEHPLCRSSLISSARPPALQWRFDWGTIREHQENVLAYEKAMVQKVKQLTTAADNQLQTAGPSAACDKYDMEFFGLGEAELQAKLLASIQSLAAPPKLSHEEDDGLSQLLRGRMLENDDNCKEETMEFTVEFTPHWSVIPIHSFGPLVAAQARLVNREYMKLVFGTHRLREHLAVHKQFQLLGNGMFCSRLSHALFDPDMDTAERQAGVALQGGSMGLRLSGRETWPPASSELRLALMGVLTETYLPPSSSATVTTNGSDAEKQPLPGDMSFAVRDLSPEEIDKCMDPGSLEALDFLRLSYKTPAPLSPVITPVILMKYDRVFRLLLRILRMLYVVGQISRDILAHSSSWDHVSDVPLRFNHEANHFVAAIASYFLETGIEMPWRRFASWLDVAEADLLSEEGGATTGTPGDTDGDADGDEDGDGDGDRGEAGRRIVSPDELRAEHERMLDHVMHTLLLRKRQQAVMRLLEDIFTSILRLSKRTRLEAQGRRGGAKGKAKASSGDKEAGAEAEADDKGKEDIPPSYKDLYDAFRKKVGVFITVCRGMSEKGGLVSQRPTTADAGTTTREENTVDRLLMKLEMSGHYSQIRV